MLLTLAARLACCVHTRGGGSSEAARPLQMRCGADGKQQQAPAALSSVPKFKLSFNLSRCDDASRELDFFNSLSDTILSIFPKCVMLIPVPC